MKAFHIYDNISQNSFQNDKYFRHVFQRNQSARFTSHNFSFQKLCRLRDIVEKHDKDGENTYGNIKGACALHAG
jgi:hypothetical protein